MREYDGYMVPEIRGQCANCRAWRDLRFELLCAMCGSSTLIGAYKSTPPERPSFQVPYRGKDYPGKLSSPHALTVGEQRDCDELDKLYAKEDKR
jgi:hypothetical protein